MNDFLINDKFGRVAFTFKLPFHNIIKPENMDMTDSGY